MSALLTTPTRRPVSRSLSGVLAQLELLAPEVVIVDDLREAVRATGDARADDDAYVYGVIDRLRRYGWLLPLRTRGTWEFAPAARSGAFRSGDPFTELRAYLTRHTDHSAAIAMESAALRLGYATHPPVREVLAVDEDAPRYGALSTYRLVRVDLGPDATGVFEGLACHTVEGLLVAIAVKPTGYHDWPNVAQWLPDAVSDADVLSDRPGSMRSLLAGRPAAAWARAAYLLKSGSRIEAAAQLLDAAPDRPTGPVYLGPRPDGRGRARQAVWDRETGVYDALIAPNDTAQEIRSPK